MLSILTSIMLEMQAGSMVGGIYKAMISDKAMMFKKKKIFFHFVITFEH